jgi:hypothetical protein
MVCQKRKCGKRMQRKHGRRAHSSVGSEQQKWAGRGGGGGGSSRRVAKPPEEGTVHGSTPAMQRCHIVHFSPFFSLIISRKKIAVAFTLTSCLPCQCLSQSSSPSMINLSLNLNFTLATPRGWCDSVKMQTDAGRGQENGKMPATGNELNVLFFRLSTNTNSSNSLTNVKSIFTENPFGKRLRLSVKFHKV